jgi:hypothetical protein
MNCIDNGVGRRDFIGFDMLREMGFDYYCVVGFFIIYVGFIMFVMVERDLIGFFCDFRVMMWV